MANIAIADLLYLAKERYSKIVSEIMNREPLLLQKFEKAADAEWDGQGRYYVIPVHLEGGQSQGFYAEGEQLPPSVAQVGDRFLCYPKAMAYTVRITRQNILAIKEGPGAFVNAKEWEVRQNTTSLREKMARAMWGDGMGVLGILAAIPVVAGGNSTITFTDQTNMQYFRKGMFIDVWEPAYPVASRRRISDMNGGSFANDETSFDVGWKILEVNRAARTIKVAGDILAGGGPGAGLDDPAAGDYVLPQNEGLGLAAAAGGSNLSTGKEITGLQALFSTGQFWPTIQTLSYATYPELQSPRDTAGAPRKLTPDLLQKMLHDIETASDKEVNFIGFDKFQMRTLLAGGLQDVRHVSAKIHLGYTEMDWNGKKFFVDRQAPPAKCVMLSTDVIGRAVLADMGPMDGAMGERIPRFAIQEWAYGADFNLINRNPVAGGWIENLTTS